MICICDARSELELVCHQLMLYFLSFSNYIIYLQSNWLSNKRKNAQKICWGKKIIALPKYFIVAF